MSEHLQKIEDVLTQFSTPTRHSFFQLRAFNINTEPTIQGRLRRCLIELNARRNSLMEMTLGIEDIQDQIELLEVEKLKIEEKDAYEDADKKIKAIELRRRDRRIESQRLKLAETQRIYRETLEEALFFVNAFRQLELQEPMLDYDDPKAQIEYWDAKYKEEILCCKLSGVAPAPQMIKEVLALPEGCEIRSLLVAGLDKSEEQHKLAAEKQHKLTTEE